MRGSVLIVDDDLDTAEMVAEGLRAHGFRATPETDPTAALEHVIGEDFDVVITDLRMRSLDGLALCDRIVGARPDVPVVLLTGHASVDAAVGALRAGAFDFLLKPVDPEILALTVERAVQHHQLKSEVHRLRTEVTEARGFGKLAGESLAMRRVFDVIARIAPTQATVLITGESGTGKELVARSIHEHSARSAGPFVAINCAAVPATLLESELFGHAKGAFTDARVSRRGLFLEAQGGTLFLDEIGEMPLEMQVKLLRALQERSVRAVGGNVEMPFDARVIAATNRDLEIDVAEKRFREDLYYRINVCSVHVPPLREREGDVPLLARAFVKRFAQKHDKAVTGIAPPAMAKLVQCPWHGNVRELENSIERAVAMAQFDQLVVEDLPERVRAYRPEQSAAFLPGTVSELLTMEQLKRRYMEHVLQLVKGNKSRAARILGFDRRTLYRKLELTGAEEPATAQAGAAPRASEPPRSRTSVNPSTRAPEDPRSVHPSERSARASQPPPAPAEARPPTVERASLEQSREGEPAAAARESRPPRASTPFALPPTPAPSPSVLVVDEDRDSLELMQILLEARGYRVATATGVAEAMRTRDIDVVLTDLDLADGSGSDLLGRFGAAPVVAMTARSREATDEAGFVGWITKPVSLEGLTRTLASVLHPDHFVPEDSEPPRAEPR